MDKSESPTQVFTKRHHELHHGAHRNGCFYLLGLKLLWQVTLAILRRRDPTHNFKGKKAPLEVLAQTLVLAYITECNHFFGINRFHSVETGSSCFQFLKPARVLFSSKHGTPSLLKQPRSRNRQDSLLNSLSTHAEAKWAFLPTVQP